MYGGFAWLTNTLGTQTVRPAGRPARRHGGVLRGLAGRPAGIHRRRDRVRDRLSRPQRRPPRRLPAARDRRPRRRWSSIGRWNLLAAALVLVAGFVHGDAHWPLWIAAVAVQYLPPLVTRAIGTFDIGIEHFAERHGLMVIIVLGESLVSVALAANELTGGRPARARDAVRAGRLGGVLVGVLRRRRRGCRGRAAAPRRRTSRLVRARRLRPADGADARRHRVGGGRLAAVAARAHPPDVVGGRGAHRRRRGACTSPRSPSSGPCWASAGPLPRLAVGVLLVAGVPLGTYARRGTAVDLDRGRWSALLLVARAAGCGDATRGRSGRMTAMTAPTDPRAVAEYKVSAVDLRSATSSTPATRTGSR